jgi:predicted DNA-binding transcriptional regulator AlpA
LANIIRPQAAWKRIGVGRSKFYADYVKTGRLKLVKLGKRARGAIDDEVDALIEELRRERDAEVKS